MCKVKRYIAAIPAMVAGGDCQARLLTKGGGVSIDSPITDRTIPTGINLKVDLP